MKGNENVEGMIFRLAGIEKLSSTIWQHWSVCLGVFFLYLLGRVVEG